MYYIYTHEYDDDEDRGAVRLSRRRSLFHYDDYHLAPRAAYAETPVPRIFFTCFGVAERGGGWRKGHLSRSACVMPFNVTDLYRLRICGRGKNASDQLFRLSVYQVMSVNHVLGLGVCAVGVAVRMPNARCLPVCNDILRFVLIFFFRSASTEFFFNSSMHVQQAG